MHVGTSLKMIGFCIKVLLVLMMIFMKLPSRNSRATGPKIRVPRGPLSSRMITHAFSSNLIYEPSYDEHLIYELQQL